MKSTENLSLSGKVALITGCSSGVGMHTATLLAKEGVKVYATMRNPLKATAIQELADKDEVSISILKLDVQDEGSVQASVSQVIQENNGIDILVNNAGFGSVRALEQATAEQIAEVMDVNFHGAVRCIRAVLPGMRSRKSGHIISISSVGGLVGQPLSEIYCAAKFALEGLIESMAIYMEPFFNIKMTLVEPAGIKSDFANRVLGDLKENQSPLQDVYGPVLASYLSQSQKRGAYEGTAQTPRQVAEIVVQALRSKSPPLRIQSSPFARAFAAEKLEADPDGTRLQLRVRREILGLE